MCCNCLGDSKLLRSDSIICVVYISITFMFRKEKSSSVEKLVAAVQAKKAASPKVLYLEEEKEEAARSRKLG